MITNHSEDFLAKIWQSLALNIETGAIAFQTAQTQDLCLQKALAKLAKQVRKRQGEGVQ
jgi:hypothetical protein